MFDNPNEQGQFSSKNDSPSSRLSDRSRSAKCSPGLRRRRNAANHCSPKDRLRLIQFLQEIDLDKALHSLSDECVLEDLICVPYDALRPVFAESLTSEEFGRLWSTLQSYRKERQLSQSPATACRDRRVSYVFTIMPRSIYSLTFNAS